MAGNTTLQAKKQLYHRNTESNNDCKEIGIETIEEYKLRRYIEEWNND